MKLNRVVLLNSGARSQAAAAAKTSKGAAAALGEAEQQLRTLEAEYRQALQPSAKVSPRGRTEPHPYDAQHAVRLSSRGGLLRWARLPVLAICIAGIAHAAMAFLDGLVPTSGDVSKVQRSAAAVAGTAPVGSLERMPVSGSDNEPVPPPRSGSISSALEQPLEASPYAGRFQRISARERDCLLRAIYYEARHEPVAGQIAVAQVVLNRVMSDRWPKTICGVVNQGHERGHSCQFSFACHRYSRASPRGEAWTRSGVIADEVTKGSNWLPELAQSTHYHRFDVSPVWREKLPVIGQIGAHIFYGDEGSKVTPLPARITASEPLAGVADQMAEPASKPPVGAVHKGSRGNTR